MGVIDQPITKERWLGCKGRPSTLNGASISTRACDDVSKAYLYATTPHMFAGRLPAAGPALALLPGVHTASCTALPPQAQLYTGMQHGTTCGTQQHVGPMAGHVWHAPGDHSRAVYTPVATHTQCCQLLPQCSRMPPDATAGPPLPLVVQQHAWHCWPHCLPTTQCLTTRDPYPMHHLPLLPPPPCRRQRVIVQQGA